MALDDITPPSTIDEIVKVNGPFDKIMDGVKRHLQIEFKANRIVGSNYKDVYLASLQLALQSAISYEQIKMEGEKLKLEKAKTDNELLLIQAKKGATIAQIKLYDRQRKGYTDDAQNKALKLLTDTYVVLKSKGGDVATNMPDPVVIQAMEASLQDHLKTVGLNTEKDFVAEIPADNTVNPPIPHSPASSTEIPGKEDDYVPSPTIPVNTTITIE